MKLQKACRALLVLITAACGHSDGVPKLTTGPSTSVDQKATPAPTPTAVAATLAEAKKVTTERFVSVGLPEAEVSAELAALEQEIGSAALADVLAQFNAATASHANARTAGEECSAWGQRYEAYARHTCTTCEAPNESGANDLDYEWDFASSDDFRGWNVSHRFISNSPLARAVILFYKAKVCRLKFLTSCSDDAVISRRTGSDFAKAHGEPGLGLILGTGLGFTKYLTATSSFSIEVCTKPQEPAPVPEPLPVPTNVPSLRIDGVLARTRPRLDVFNLSGTGFSPNGGVSRYFRYPSGGAPVAMNPKMNAESGGQVFWQYQPPCTAPLGTYVIWAADDTTGQTSNTVEETVTDSPSCATPPARATATRTAVATTTRTATATPTPTSTQGSTATNTPTPTATATPTTPLPPAYEGYFDGVQCNGVIFGWARDQNSSDPVWVNVYYDGAFMDSGRADRSRPDLAGQWAWQVPFPVGAHDGKLHRYSARISGTSFELVNSPRDVTCPP